MFGKALSFEQLSRVTSVYQQGKLCNVLAKKQVAQI